MSAYLRRMRQTEHQQRMKAKEDRDAEIRAELDRDTFLPMRIILSPENHQGTNPLGVPWGEWAVSQREEAALALLIRKDYRDRFDKESDGNGARLLAIGAAKWPNVAHRMMHEHPEVLLESASSDTSVVHHMVNRSQKAALQLLSDQDLLLHRAVPDGPSVIEVAAKWPDVAAELLDKHIELGYVRQADGWPVFQSVALHKELALRTLAIPGVGALHGPSGRLLAELIIEYHRWDVSLLSRFTPEIWALPSLRGGTLAHWAVREIPGLATALIANPAIASIADERGVTVAHEAVMHNTAAAKAALDHPHLGALTDASGRTVRRSAANRVRTPSAYFSAMRQRLEEIVDRSHEENVHRQGVATSAPAPSDSAVLEDRSSTPPPRVRR